MRLATFLVLSALAGVAASQSAPAPGPAPAEGPWHAWLEAQEHTLPFGLELRRDASAESGWKAVVVNGEERLDVPEVAFEDGALTLAFPHYDSVIMATVSGEGRRLDGSWRKRRNADEWPELLSHAPAGAAPRFESRATGTPAAELDAAVAGRWAVQFKSDDEPAVGEFHLAADGEARGTFLTTTGDHRYLAGRIDREPPAADGGAARYGLRLSCFDGSHAFLYLAVTQPDGTLTGDFWSGGRFHDTWTARRDDKAALPDGFSLTHARDGANVNDLSFPDLDGKMRKLSEPQYAGKLRLIEIFGSWCPNCADEAEELVQLQRDYAGQGLHVVGLAFELTGELRRDAELVRRYAARHGASWPMLLAGVQDREKATAALGVIDELRAWPTTLFVDAGGKVRAVYTGWCGPATGEANREQHARIVKLIESLLAE
jgi:thiol-disulfide isomerase/thioredoxin